MMVQIFSRNLLVMAAAALAIGGGHPAITQEDIERRKRAEEDEADRRREAAARAAALVAARTRSQRVTDERWHRRPLGATPGDKARLTAAAEKRRRKALRLP